MKTRNRMAALANASMAAIVLIGMLALDGSPAQSAEPKMSVLVFSRTAGFRHDSIPAGIAALQLMGNLNDFRVDASEDAALFDDTVLVRYRVVVFLNTTGDVLNADQQAAFERFIRGGGGFVGIHSASDTEYDWPWYEGLVGTYFRRHPAIQSAMLKVVDPSHVSTRHLPIDWKRTDEWYNFRRDLDPGITVLVGIDERTYLGGAMGAGHPISWFHAYDGGRAWYTAIGHTAGSYSEPLVIDHLRGGILWAAGIAPE